MVKEGVLIGVGFNNDIYLLMGAVILEKVSISVGQKKILSQK